MERVKKSILKNSSSEKGITLMAVIITIIIMVILLGATIRLSIEGEIIGSAEKVENRVTGKLEEGQEDIGKIIDEKNEATISDDAFVPQYVEESYSDGNGLKDYKIYGNSIQKGTPLPDLPAEIQSVGEKTSNLVDINNPNICANSTYTLTNYPVKIENGILYNAGKYGSADGVCIYIERPENAQYLTLSFETDDNAPEVSTTGVMTRFYYFNEIDETTGIPTDLKRGGFTNYVKGKNSVSTIDCSSYKYVGFCVMALEKYSIAIKNIKLEEGKNATDYEPYAYKIPVTATNEAGESVRTNIYLDEPLRKIGDYADFIDFKNKRVVRNVGNVVLDTSLPYVFYNYNTDLDNTYHYYINASNKVEPQIIKETEMLCNRFVGGNIAMNRNESDSFLTSRYGTRVYGQIQKSLIDQYDGATEKDRLIQFFNEHYTELDYVLITPKIQYIDLPKINTLEGKNTITIQTKIQPSNVTLEF